MKKNLKYFTHNPASNFSASQITKTVLNNINYCVYQVSDAAMGHQYYYDYYATVVGQKCLVVELVTSSSTCENYLPLETGNTQQATNYNNCVAQRTSRPTTLQQITSTFTFSNQNQTSCNTSSDCPTGQSCLVKGPLIANQPEQKVCVPPGQAVSL